MMTKMDQLLFLEQFIAMWDLSTNYYNPPLQQQLTDLLEGILMQEDLRMSFKHLPFNAVFEAEKITNQSLELGNLKVAQELGLPENVVQDKLKNIYGY